MSRKHDIARKVLMEFLGKHKSFTLNEVMKYLIEKTGTIEVAPGVTVEEWLDNMVSIGFIKEKAIGHYEID